MKNEQKKTNVAITEQGANIAPAAVILDGIPANVKNDVTTAQGAELATVKTAVEKTPLELANERKTAARKAAKTACVNLYMGKAAELLKNRVVEENKNGKQTAIDFQYSYVDENGATVPMAGKIPVTAVFSKDAAAAIRKAAETVQNSVVAFHVADADGKAKIRAAVEKDVNALFAFLSVRPAKKSEVVDILESAYMTNANGDYDSENENAIISSVSAIARRILKGRENAENADRARKDAASKAKEVKAA